MARARVCVAHLEACSVIGRGRRSFSSSVFIPRCSLFWQHFEIPSILATKTRTSHTQRNQRDGMYADTTGLIVSLGAAR